MDSPLIVTSNSQLKENFNTLKSGDLVACLLRDSESLEHLIIDLLERGVVIFPSARSQIATRSKCFQVRLFGKWMVPYTQVISSKKDLVLAIKTYEEIGIGPVITKLDRGDCGLGINKWSNIEELFNAINFTNSPPFPFVLQPFEEDALDIRVVWLGEKYIEAYTRKNPYSFRNNMHFGGENSPYELGDEEKSLCKRVMETGGFPFAHIDLLRVMGKDMVYLSEISLFGGLKGARISQKECNLQRVRIIEEFINNYKKRQDGQRCH